MHSGPYVQTLIFGKQPDVTSYERIKENKGKLLTTQWQEETNATHSDECRQPSETDRSQTLD